MFQLLKGLKVNPWVLIGLVMAVVGGLIFFYGKYTDGLVTQGGLVEQNAHLRQSNETQLQSAAITDGVLSEYVTEKVDAQRQQEQSRTGVIDEFIDLSGHSVVVQWPAPKSDPVAETRPRPVPVAPTQPQPAGSGNDDRALVVLAQRLRERYDCATTGTATCYTEGPHRPVLRESASDGK